MITFCESKLTGPLPICDGWEKAMWWLLVGDYYGVVIWFFREHVLTVVWCKHPLGCIVVS